MDTFFEKGIVAHVPMGDPICTTVNNIIAEVIKVNKPNDVDFHFGGTYINMEGPSFSSKAESRVYQSWGASVIGMTNFTEAKLAKEAEIAYNSICMVTDYDCWHEGFDSVSVEMVIQNLLKNVETAKTIIKEVVKRLGEEKPESKSHTSLKTSIVTNLAKVPKETLENLTAILAPYVNQTQ